MRGRWSLRRYFNRRWYAAQYGHTWEIRAFPRWYHRRRGWKKGYSPHPLFAAAWYLAEHPDVARARIDPLAHYVAHGWREGRCPHPVFDVSWYLATNPDVAAAGIEPLAHYLADGWREGRSPHPAFDAPWYLARHPDVAAAGCEPLTHYLEHGWREGRQPHPLFDGYWYRCQLPRSGAQDGDPLTHYLAIGWREGREPSGRLSLEAYVASLDGTLPESVNPFVNFLVTEYAPIARDHAAIESLLERFGACHDHRLAGRNPAHSHPGDVRAIAMYLPQFHRVPENDRWWGEGFTEWTNVRRGRPMYAGHEQPHVPHEDIGSYDLDDPAVLERQAALAGRYGIHGFCYYYYWFDGRRILEKPIDRMLRSGKPDFPFCFCWANENWTRTWDGLDHGVLLEQRHSLEGDERFLRDLLPALRDPRYIRIEGKPLLAVYRPALLEDAATTADRWRELARREGLEGLHLAAVQSFDRDDPRGFGFDSAIQFPPLLIPSADLAAAGDFEAEPGFRGHVHDYRDAVRHSISQARQRYPLFRGVMPGWDNTARRMERGTSWVNATPERYGEWLRAAVAHTQSEHPDGRQFLFINAWNEWAEGAHLEPDTRHGYRFLEETLAALKTAEGRAADGSIETTSAAGDGRRHVLVDLLFCQPGFHGGAEYGKAVFRQVVDAAVNHGDVQIWAAFDPMLFIDEWVLALCRRHAVNLVTVKSFDDIVSLVDSERFDAFFAPAIVVYTGYEYLKRVGGPLKFRPGRTRVIGTLLDVRDLELAEEWDRIAEARRRAGCVREASFSAAAWQAEEVRQTGHAEALRRMYRGICESPALHELVTISEYSARSIRDRVGTSRPIHVLYAPEKGRPEPERFTWPGIDLAADPFAVVLNAGREEKNAASVVAALDRLFLDPAFTAAHPGLKLVLTGIRGLDELGIVTPVHADRFLTMPHVSASRLEWLLSRARFLAYASFNEGFGYPPLEAMVHLTPSLIGDNTSVPEICGAAAVVCDPFDLDSVAEAIRTILDAPPSPHALRERLAETAARQQHDMRSLAELICGGNTLGTATDEPSQPAERTTAA